MLEGRGVSIATIDAIVARQLGRDE